MRWGSMDERHSRRMVFLGFKTKTWILQMFHECLKKKMLCWTSVMIHCTRCSLCANKEDTMVQIQTLWVIILLSWVKDVSSLFCLLWWYCMFWLGLHWYLGLVSIRPHLAIAVAVLDLMCPNIFFSLSVRTAEILLLSSWLYTIA